MALGSRVHESNDDCHSIDIRDASGLALEKEFAARLSGSEQPCGGKAYLRCLALRTSERRYFHAKLVFYVVHCAVLFTLYYVAVWDVEPLWQDSSWGCQSSIAENRCGYRGKKCENRKKKVEQYQPAYFECRADCIDWQQKNDAEDPKINVYGGKNGTYASISALCPAAIHAGVVSNSGGKALVQRLPGQQLYESGGEQNGIVAKPMGYFAESMQFSHGGDEVSSRRTGVRHAYFAVMVVSLMAFCVVFVPAAVRRGEKQETSCWAVCSVEEYVAFLALNGLTYVQLVQGRDDAEGNVVLLTSKVFIILPISLLLVHRYIRHVLTSTQGPFLALVFTGLFCVALRLEYITKLIPDIDVKGHKTTEHALFTPAKVVVLVLIALAVVILTGVTIRDFFSVLGPLPAARLLARILATRGAVLGIIFLLPLCVVSSYAVHLHHFFLGATIATCPQLATPAHSATAGLGLGFFVEGVSRWGWAPNFDRVASDERSDAVKTPQLNATFNNETNATLLFWSSNNTMPWTRVYLNHMLWFDGETQENYTIDFLALNTTNYVYAHSQRYDGIGVSKSLPRVFQTL